MVLDTKEEVSRRLDQRNASKSQRAMRIEWGMRPRHTVGARKIERRAKHAIKGTPL